MNTSRKKNPPSPLYVPQYDYYVKFMLIGDAGVGKTSLLNRYVNNRYSSEYKASIGFDFLIKKCFDSEQKKVGIYIWDEAGQEEYRINPNKIYLHTDAVIVVFDVTNENSFKKAVQRLAEFKKTVPNDCNIILIGNKCDDVDNRVVTKKAVEEFMQLSPLQPITYFETSAKTGENVNCVFTSAANLVMNRLLPAKASASSSTPNNTDANRRDALIADLQKYINRINPTNTAKPDFSHGFWFFKNSRALNREANYYLAKELLNELTNESGETIEAIFDRTNVNGRRFDLMDTHGILQNPNYVNRGIRSAELNSIINKAKP